ncbi:hypothetical protein MTR_7g055843 [Medicago truncatula]|uniref:Uncharacterized protein n=1 Tax=Medicago truncatula TaxID=3880 RepID=A0A072TYK4_MEDTR|nr:hypothetical protein MTR_7g055843 [Medicago truncatula]
MVATPNIPSICPNKGCGIMDAVGVTNICAKCFKENYKINITKIVGVEFEGYVSESCNIYLSPVVVATKSRRLSNMKMNKK